MTAGAICFKSSSPFGACAELRHHRKSGDVAARPGNVIDKTLGNRIDNRRKDNREGGGCFLESSDALARRSQHHIRRKPSQFRGITTKAIGISGRPAVSTRTLRPTTQPAPAGPEGILLSRSVHTDRPRSCASALQRAAYAPAAAHGMTAANDRAAGSERTRHRLIARPDLQRGASYHSTYRV